MTNFFYSNLRSQTRKLTTTGEDSPGNSQLLYDEVIRKNHEMIKALLIKMSDIYSRQEEYEQAIVSINLKIQDVVKNNRDLHHEMRANQLQVEQKHQILLNEVKAVKNVLKIPDPARSHQDYLTSGFFKEQSSLVTGRGRGRKRNKTNYDEVNLAPENNEKKHPTVEDPPHRQLLSRQVSTLKVRPQSGKKEYMPYANQRDLGIIVTEPSKINRQSASEVQSLGKSRMRDLKEISEQFQNQITALKDRLEINAGDNQRKLSQFREELREQAEERGEKIRQEINDKNNWNRIDFQELQKYLESKIKEQLSQRISKAYFQQSLSNLKQSWQEELQEVYSLVESRLRKEDLQPLEERLNEIACQIEGWTSLNSLKIHNISYSSTCKSTPFRVNLQRTSVADQESNNRITRESQESKIKKNNLKYCNSLSLLSRRPQSQNKSPRIFDDKSRMIEEISEQKWKQKATETLGLACKKVRRQRRS